MRERAKDFLHFLPFLLAGAVAAYALWVIDRHRHDTPPETIVKTDTVVVVHYDTITAYKPVPFNVYVVDTMWVPVTVHEHDTVWAQIPREQKVYKDTTFTAYVSGYRPELDSIEVYQRTKIVTVTNNVRIPPTRWSWGVQAGVGVNTGGTVTPYLGVGIQYRLGDFEIRK